MRLICHRPGPFLCRKIAERAEIPSSIMRSALTVSLPTLAAVKVERPGVRRRATIYACPSLASLLVRK